MRTEGRSLCCAHRARIHPNLRSVGHVHVEGGHPRGFELVPGTPELGFIEVPIIDQKRAAIECFEQVVDSMAAHRRIQ
ncbi:hypothetical protein BQ8420_13895 [Nocardiopsis sp. JB363]|nr:hypothetical protein BQ8420_13895 [Nocardiopsis sp. JB363]